MKAKRYESIIPFHMPKPTRRITLTVVLDHIKGLAASVHILEGRFNGFEKRFDGMEQRMGRMELKMDRGFAQVNRRLDNIEFEDLPRRVSRLEDKVFAGADT